MITFSMSLQQDGIGRALSGVRAAARGGAVMAATAGLAEARRRVRVGATGALRDGLQLMPGHSELEVGFGVEGVREAPFQEFGTHKMHAQPYLSPGAAIARRELVEQTTSLIRAAAR